MERIDAKATKERILKILNEKGPGLPVQLAKAVGLNTIFTSAFLSELASEGVIKISNMKVGGSPLYYTVIKKDLLENYFQYLNPKENEAVKLLKERKFLVDSEQHPAIRVALRSLKDFAFPINKEGKMIWRYYLAEESELNKIEIKEEKPAQEKIVEPNESVEKQEKIIEEKIVVEEIKTELKKEEKNEDFERVKEELEQKKKEIDKLKEELSVNNKAPQKKVLKKIIPPKKSVNEEFLNNIKEKLINRGYEISSIEEFDKKKAILKVKNNGQEILVAAFDKKKIEESELLKISKRASTMGLNYSLMFKGEMPKKTKEIIEAYKRLNSTEKIE